jgi:hypothetical protein
MTTRTLQLGINLDANRYYGIAGQWSDIAKGFSGWFAPTGVVAAYSPTGYPTTNGMQTQSSMLGCPAGVYSLSFTGTATLTPKWCTMSAVTKNATTGVSTATVTVAKPNSEIIFTVSGLNAADPFGDMHLYQPGMSATSPMFAPAWTAWLKPFTVCRGIDWAGVNLLKSSVPPNVIPASVEWASRITLTGWDQTSAGVCYEFFLDLCQQNNLTPWINVPFMASADYIAQLAAIVASYNFPTVYVELANEVWNSSFGQWQQAYNLASAAGSIYAGSVPACYADRARQMGFIFRSALGAKAQIVLGAQVLNPTVATSALSWIQSKYGDAATSFNAIAGTGYFPTTTPPVGTTLAQMVASNQAYIANDLATGLAAHKSLANQYGMAFVGYEGGQSLQSWNNPFGSPADIPFVAQTDATMGQLYTQVLDTCQASGMTLFNHCSFMAPWTKTGMFPLQQNVTDAPSQKYTAITTFAAQPMAMPAPPVTPLLSQTIMVGTQKLAVSITPSN